MKTINLTEAQIKTLIFFLAQYIGDYPGNELTEDLSEIVKALEDTQQLKLI